MTTLPKGFRAGAVAAQIKKNGKPDVALFVSDRDAAAAAVFTTNKVAAAPVLRGREILKTHAGSLRAVLINAGCANACTGDDGLRNARVNVDQESVSITVTDEDGDEIASGSLDLDESETWTTNGGQDDEDDSEDPEYD
jgi:glutamate N-acetyltransferase/amino-acid N-acetyltransferase